VAAAAALEVAGGVVAAGVVAAGVALADADGLAEPLGVALPEA